MRKIVLSALLGAAMTLGATGAQAAASGQVIKHVPWSFNGVFGTYDRAALKRGYQVYDEVCSGCHSLRLVAYRNLTEIGFTADEVTAIAADKEVFAGPDGDGEVLTEDGEFRLRPALPSDRFASPFANELAARSANDGALPPDLSLMAKARTFGPDYIYSLLTGYHDEAPDGVTLPEGMNFNDAFPGNQIAMAAPLYDEAVEYADGTEPTLDQHAMDVAQFLNWAAEPELEQRKSMGVKVMLFLLLLTAMLFALKKRIWADVH